MAEEVNESTIPETVRQAASHNGRLGGLKVGAKRRGDVVDSGRTPSIPKEAPPVPDEAAMKAARSEFARMGGKVGGRVRSERLTKERKQEIGRLGGKARWSKHV